MTTDVWKTPEEACKILGNGWQVGGNGKIYRINQYGVEIASRRIFRGDEHPLAQAGMVVFHKDELK